MADFEQAFEFVLSHEGGYSDDPKDHGGQTKFGISKAQYPHIDIPSLTLDQAKSLYLVDYWVPYHIGDITNQRVANVVFDLLINMGPYRDIQIVQRACNAYGYDIDIDGKIGPQTLKAINNCDPELLVSQICNEAEAFYRSLNQPRFLKGWLERIGDDRVSA